MMMRWLTLCLLLMAFPVHAQNIPRVAVTMPTTATTYTTTTTPLMLGGTSRDNRGVTQVTWTSDRGGTGMAQGTTQWSASVPLQVGVNTLTLTAWDAQQHQGHDVVTVTLTTPPPSPGPITVEWSYRSTVGDAFQMERCTAPQPCSMVAVAVLALAERSWIDVQVLASLNYCYRLAVVAGGTVGPYSNTLCSP